MHALSIQISAPAVKYYVLPALFLYNKSPINDDGAFANLLPMKLSSPLLVTDGALSFTSVGGTDIGYTPLWGVSFKKTSIFLFFLIDNRNLACVYLVQIVIFEVVTSLFDDETGENQYTNKVRDGHESVRNV